MKIGYFPCDWKEGLVTPLLKSAGLLSDFKNLHPISNLQYISKLTERAVFEQTEAHMTSHSLYPLLQSAYRSGHSTETALLKVHNNLLMNMDAQHVTLLVLLSAVLIIVTAYYSRFRLYISLNYSASRIVQLG